MSQIKSRNTKPELLLQQLLKDLKIPFNCHDKTLPGAPDIFIPQLGLVIHIHGCFWHGHQKCRYFVVPKTNKSFWIKKINKNAVRDKLINTRLRKEYSFQICTVWECEIRNGSFLDKILKFL